MTKYAVRLVLAPAAPVTPAQADALIDLLTPDGGERASVEWWGSGIDRVIVECVMERRYPVEAVAEAQSVCLVVLPAGARVVEIGARERPS